MATVNLLPGHGFIQETTSSTNLVPGVGIVKETISATVTGLLKHMLKKHTNTLLRM